jgi:hypothetical protein
MHEAIPPKFARTSSARAFEGSAQDTSDSDIRVRTDRRGLRLSGKFQFGFSYIAGERRPIMVGKIWIGLLAALAPVLMVTHEGSD